MMGFWGKKNNSESMKRQYILRLRKYFLTGLIVTVPLGVTFFVLRFFINLADKVLHLLPKTFYDMYPVFKIPGLGVVVTLTLVVIIGFLAHNFLGRKLVGFSEKIISKIPIAGSIYSASKQLLESIFAQSEDHFERVVLVEYPRKGIISLAFVSGQVNQRMGFDEPYLNLFLPTTPNPTSGFFLMVPEKDITPTNLSVEDAFKIIISAGIVMPKEDAAAIMEREKESNEK